MATEIERGGMDLGGPHEPSYYEIALTNRQVVVAFIVLLVCLVAAFFSGVWIGRESSTRALAQLARATPPGAAGAEGAAGAGAAEKSDGQALQEFKFFNEQRKKPAAEGRAGRQERERQVMPPAEAPGGRSKRQGAGEPGVTPQAGGVASAEAPRAAPSAAAVSPRVPPPIPAASRPAPPPAETAGEGEPLPAPAASPRARSESAAASASRPDAAATPSDAAPSAKSAAPNAASAGNLVIQVFSSSDKAQAEKVRDRLVKGGQQAFLSPIDKGGVTMYRVRIGPFPSRETAEKVAERVRREQKLDTWITPK